MTDIYKMILKEMILKNQYWVLYICGMRENSFLPYFLKSLHGFVEMEKVRHVVQNAEDLFIPPPQEGQSAAEAGWQ